MNIAPDTPLPIVNTTRSTAIFHIFLIKVTVFVYNILKPKDLLTLRSFIELTASGFETSV